MRDIYNLINETSSDVSCLKKDHLTKEEKASVLSFIREQEQSAAAAAGRRTGSAAAADRKKEYENITKISSTQKKRGDHMRRSTKRKAIAAAAVAAAVFVGGTAYAAVHWSRGLTESMHITEEQKTELEKTDIVSFVGQSVTKGDVTVSTEQCIVDNYCAYISFRVDGYQIGEGQEPGFDTIDVSLDGKGAMDEGAHFNWVGSFYNGVVTGPNGEAVYADGSPIDPDHMEKFVQEDGSMEFILILSTNEKGLFINKPVHVEFTGLGTVEKAAYTPGLEENFAFDWTFAGSSEAKEIDLNEVLGDSGATVTHVEISPVSICVNYDFPRVEIPIEAEDENGNAIERTEYKEPPAPMGLRMKDGSMYPYLFGGPGSFGYESEDSDNYCCHLSADRVIDPDQVESILFLKSSPEGEGNLTEENFYMVPVN